MWPIGRIARFLIGALLVSTPFVESVTSLRADSYLDIWSTDGSIKQFDLGTGQTSLIDNTGSDFNGYVGLGVNPSGDLLSANPSNSNLLEYLPGGVVQSYYPGYLVDSVSGAAYNSQGQLYTVSANFEDISYGPKQDSVFVSGLNQPASIAFNSTGDLYVTNNGNNTLQEYSPTGTLLHTYSYLNGPLGLAINSAGDVFFSNYGGNSIEELNTNGTLSVFDSLGNGSQSTGLLRPSAMTFDSSGDLFVADQGNGTIKEYIDGNANDSVNVATGFTGATGLAFTDVSVAATPEPSSWLLGVLGLIGFAALRRRAQVRRS